MLAASLLAVDSSTENELRAAVKRLGDNYSWHVALKDPASHAEVDPAPMDGMLADGIISICMQRKEGKTEILLMGAKGAVKRRGKPWESFSALERGDDFGGMFIARLWMSYKAPAAQAAELAGKTKDLACRGDLYSGDLTEEGARSLLWFRGPRDGEDPIIRDAKGSAKFWLKNGQLWKCEYKVQGAITFGGKESNSSPTITVEIKNVGSTRIDIPEDAKSSLF